MSISKAYLKSMALAVCIISEHLRSQMLLFQNYFNKGSEVEKVCLLECLLPERKVMRLSDLYVQMPEGEEPSLELKVLQLNINPGYNEKLKEKCKTLGEYTAYVEKVRRYEKEYSLTEAAEKAIDECIQEGILSDFFRMQRKEALRMILFEYDKKKYDKLLREYYKKEGREQKTVEIFLNMLDDNIPCEQAQRLTGLDEKTVQRLVREKNEYSIK